MALTKEERLNNVHQEALACFDRIQSSIRDERLQCLRDRRFYSIAGAQWEGPLSTQFQNKPMMEFNKIHLSIIRIFNEYRNNRIDISFISKDGKDRDKLADTCSMLYRADEQDSCAEEAYDNAFEEGVGGGFGAWRLRACYEDESDEEDDYQRIKIEPIFDADSCVFFDLDAKRYDKADAKRCYVLTAMTYDAYIDEYDDDPASWPKEIHQNEFDWTTPDVVYIAELYIVEEKTEIIHIYRGLEDTERRVSDKELKDDETLEEVLTATGFHEIRQKKTKKKRVHKYIMSGNRILEDCGYIAGQNIPIVPYYGKRWFVDNVERCMGHVRLAIDAQRLANMQRSKLAEIAAVSNIKKAIMTPEQVTGHELMWADDSQKDYPYLLVNPILDAAGNTTIIGPASYTQSPDIPPAMAALLQMTEQDMSDMLGKQEAGEEMRANISGRAVELVQQRLDMQTFIYISNNGKSKKRSGEIWLSMEKDLLIEKGRKVKGLTEQNKSQMIELFKPMMSEDGAQVFENDLSEAHFDVAVEIGPSSASKKQATVRALTSMMAITQDPEIQQVLGAMTMLNMEGEGISDVRDYFRQKLVRMGVVKPTEEEIQAMQQEAANKQPDPNAQFLQASAEQAQAEAAKARADTVLTIAKSKETEAKTLETMSNIDMKRSDQVIKTMDMMHQHAQDEMSANTGA